jgi:hypothetical protein
MKKKFIFSTIAIVIFLGGALFVVLLSRQGWADIDEASDPFVPASQMSGVPTSATITLGTSQGSVTMNNFYQSSLGAQEQYIILKQNANYEINYDTYVSMFYIYVFQAPFSTNRTQAENDFLTTLNISQADACKLDVGEGAAPSVDQSLASSTLPLSFCGSLNSGQ